VLSLKGFEMRARLSIAKQGLTIVVLLLVVQLFFVGYIAVLLQDARAKLAKERHVVAVISGSSHIANLTQRLGIALAQTAFPQRLRDMIGKSESLNADKLKKELDGEFRKLRVLAGNDPKAQEMIDEQVQIVNEANRQATQDIDYGLHEDAYKLRGFTAEMLSTSHDISGQYDKFLARYRLAEEESPKQVASAIAKLKKLMILGAVLNLVAGLIFAYYFVKRVSSRLDRFADNVNRFKNGQNVHPTLPTHDSDEIGQLESMFRKMIDALGQARHTEETLVQGAYDVICTIDPDGVFTEVNNASLRQWGYKKDELIGQTIDLVVSSQDIENVRKSLERLSNRSGFISFESGIQCIDGVRKDASWACYWSPENKSIFCFIRDVSELSTMEVLHKAREEQVRTLMANLPVGILVTDGKGLVKSANHKIESLLERPIDSLLEKPIDSFLTKPVDETLRGALKGKNGEQIVAQVSTTALNAGSSIENLIVVEDIRERVRLENMKRDFVALLRENLRTPLISVRDMVAGESGSLEGPTAARVERITSNADRLLRLIDELLTIETLSPGKLIGEIKPASVEEILEQSVSSLNDYALKQGVSIVVEKLNVEVMADKDRVVQVVINLLSNAIKFSPAKSEVVVAATVADSSVEFSITDSGKGIPEELHEAIFKPYVQARKEDTRKGTGLGLPICKAIVDSHHGSIGVNSTAAGGSRFWFRIPKVE